MEPSSKFANQALGHDEDSRSETSSHDLHGPTEEDRAVLEDEEQQERLLAGEDLAGDQTQVDNGGRDRRRGRRKRRRNKRRDQSLKDEEGSLMYEMEEARFKDDASSQSSSSSLELDRVNQLSKTKVYFTRVGYGDSLTKRCSGPAQDMDPRNRHTDCSSVSTAPVRLIQDVRSSSHKPSRLQPVKWHLYVRSYDNSHFA